MKEDRVRSFSITKASGLVTKTISIKKFLGWSTEQRRRRGTISISSTAPAPKACSGAHPCYWICATRILA